MALQNPYLLFRMTNSITGIRVRNLNSINAYNMINAVCKSYLWRSSRCLSFATNRTFILSLTKFYCTEVHWSETKWEKNNWLRHTNMNWVMLTMTAFATTPGELLIKFRLRIADCWQTNGFSVFALQNNSTQINQNKYANWPGSYKHMVCNE